MVQAVLRVLAEQVRRDEADYYRPEDPCNSFRINAESQCNTPFI